MVLYYLILFIVFSFMGWILDSCYRSCESGKLLQSGYFPLPLCPVYGFGGLMLVFVYSRLVGYPAFFQIIIAGFSIIMVELIGGLFCVTVLKSRLWDYSRKSWNVYGHICLYHSVIWMFAAAAFYFFAFPIIQAIEYLLHMPCPLTMTDAYVFLGAVVIASVSTWMQYKIHSRNHTYTVLKRNR